MYRRGFRLILGSSLLFVVSLVVAANGQGRAGHHRAADPVVEAYDSSPSYLYRLDSGIILTPVNDVDKDIQRINRFS